MNWKEEGGNKLKKKKNMEYATHITNKGFQKHEVFYKQEKASNHYKNGQKTQTFQHFTDEEVWIARNHM